ncbi:MAG: thiamine pyrophosphate-binding protein [Hyphomicrobiaceae bacterium]|nr:thiamine pyrophosphate-binding protein [Hyphomicrobiaceae bacterium]
MSASSRAAGPTGQLRVADIVAGTIAAHGVRLAFGMPGGEIVTFVDALRSVGIRFVLCRHETSAAYMAGGASTVTGDPGLLVTTLGPGLANAVNGIADAAQERIPLIVMSGVVDGDVRGRYTHQIFDQQALLRSLVKGSFEIGAEGAGAVTARAIRLAMTPPMGPVHIDFPPAIAARTAVATDRVWPATRAFQAAPASDDAALAAIAEKLGAAERPLIVAGFEAARTPGATAVVTALAERLAAPVITTYKAKGTIDETHALSLGGAGLSPRADAALLPLVRAADAVLLAGYDPIEMRTGWLDPFDSDALVVDMTAAPVDHAMHRTDVQIVGPLTPTLLALGDALRTLTSHAPPRQVWPDGAPREARSALERLFAPPSDWGPHAVFATIEDLLPAGAVLTADSGAHRILLSQQMKIRRPLGLLQSNGLSTMACAIPLAAGVKAVSPATPVVAILGDGGLEMGLGELATLRDEGLPIVVVCLQDESLALIELKQAKMGLTRAGVRLGATDFPAIARAMGGYGARISSRAELEVEFNAAFKRTTFSLLVPQIEASAYVDRI